MSLEDEKFLMNIENDEADETFADDDDCDVIDQLVYEEHRWPKNEPTSTGFSFKGKKRPFIKLVENLKILMKKGNQKILDNVSFKVLDARKVPHGLEYDVEILKENERGIAILKIFGPNTKKGCTLMVNKSKKHEG